MLTLIVVVQTGASLDLLVLIWLLVVAAALGDRVLGLIAPIARKDWADRLILGIALGLGALALLTLSLGMLHLLHPLAAYGLLVGSTLLFVPTWLRSIAPDINAAKSWLCETWKERDLRFGALVASSLAICLWGGLVWAIAPSIHYDSLAYHLSAPATYVQQHAIVEISGQYRSYLAHYAEMLYTLALLLAGQPLPALIHLTFGLLAVALILVLGWRIGGWRVGLLAALLFYSVPLVTWESGTAYNDLVVVLYAAASMYAALRWWLTDEPDWLIVAGLMGGLAFGTKISASVLLAPLALLLCCAMTYRHGISLRSLTGLLRFGLPALALAAPWLIRDALWAGNPVFPFLTGLFPGSKWQPQTISSGLYRRGGGILAFLRLPWDLVVHGHTFDTQMADGIAGGIPLLALPWLYIGCRPRRRVTTALLSLTGLGVGVWFMVVQNLRYLLPFLPCLALLASLNIDTLWTHLSGRWHKRWLFPIGVAALLLYAGATRLAHIPNLWQIPDRYPYRYVFGLEKSDAFLSRALITYDALQFLDQQDDGQHHVLAVATNQTGLYSTSTIECAPSSWELQQMIAQQLSGQDLAQALEKRGYDYLLIDWQANRAAASSEGYCPELLFPKLDQDFLQAYARLEFARHNVHVYRFMPGGAEHRETVELLENGGFEETGQDGIPVRWLVHGCPKAESTNSAAHSGQVAVQVEGTASLFQRVAVEPGELHMVGHWTRADRKEQLARLQINWLDEYLQLVEVSIEVVPVGMTWQWHEMPASAPANAIWAEVYVSAHGESEIWFDDLTFLRLK